MLRRASASMLLLLLLLLLLLQVMAHLSSASLIIESISPTRFAIEGVPAAARIATVCTQPPVAAGPSQHLRARVTAPSTSLRFPTRDPVIELPSPTLSANGYPPLCLPLSLSDFLALSL